MRVWIGTAGGGTAAALERVREALSAGDGAARLIVPTATMARHLRNRLAREGLLLRRRAIQTLSGFLDEYAGQAREASGATLYLIVEQAARRVNRREFGAVARLPGFCASLARTVAEFSSAGCDSARLAGSLPEAPLAAAFQDVYRQTERELARRGLSMRSARIAAAAEKIEAQGLGGLREIWLDGFHALPDPELRLLAALDGRARVTLSAAAGEWTTELEARVSALGISCEVAGSAAGGARKAAAPVLFRAPSMEREVEEIARRILRQAAEGRAFREIGIVVRAMEAYVPILRTTLARFGIPARFYFDSDLERHPAVRFAAGAVDAMLSGWDHERTLAVLRLAPRFADSNAMDRLDFAVREQIPNAGLGPLKALLVGPGGGPAWSGAERVQRKIERLAEIEEWRSFTLSPADWAAQMRALGGMFRAARPADGAGHEQALEWRSQAAALRAFEDALDRAAEALEPARQMPVEEFWGAAKSALRLTPLRLEDERRNVVHVLSAHEARQWELPAMFVCGMTERQFPQFHRADAFFPDEARRRLNGAGIRVRTASDFEREERALFDAALAAATETAVLSYPEFDARGEENLPSVFLEGLFAAETRGHGDGAEVLESQGLRPEAVAAGSRGEDAEELPAPSGSAVGGAISSPALLRVLREKTERVSPTALETFLKCPFQYFARHTLRLRERPVRPEKRLDFLVQGEIVHETLATWLAERRDIVPLFESVFARALDEHRIPRGYHAERLRNAMREDLREFAADQRWPYGEFRSRAECDFAFALDAETWVRGKIDRLDETPDGRACVIDYKYSAAQGVKKKLDDANLLQAPLYSMAAEAVFSLRPAGMFYVGLKGGVTYAGWTSAPVGEVKSQPIPEGWLEAAAETTRRAVREIRAGRIGAAPEGGDACAWCEARDICRRRAAGVAPELAAGESA
jgi:ATP-dependent helicase/DNAse subunit B